MRERILVNMTTMSGSYISAHSPYGSTYANSVLRHQINAMWDIETPDFYERMRSGEVINNPMYKLTQDLNAVWSTFGAAAYVEIDTGEDTGDLYNTSLTFFGPGPLTSTSEIDAFLAQFEAERTVAITKAWNNVDVSEIQALASLGEMPETIRWIASITGRMIAILRAFRSRQRFVDGVKRFYKTSSVRSEIISAAEYWLEFRYAVRPLVFECAQATRAIERSIQKGSRITARGSNSVTDVETETVVRTRPSFTSYSNLSATVSRKSIYRAGVLYDIDSDINGLTALWGLDQPLESVWELIPFSFIIDWFFNVGQTIAAWTVNPSLSPLTSWVTEEHSFVVGPAQISAPSLLNEVHPGYPTMEGRGFYSSRTASGSSVTLIKRRTVCPPRAILPTFNMKLDWAKLVDLAAIGQALFRGLREK